MHDHNWLILTATLPPPSELRVRVWRALKATRGGHAAWGFFAAGAGARRLRCRSWRTRSRRRVRGLICWPCRPVTLSRAGVSVVVRQVGAVCRVGHRRSSRCGRVCAGQRAGAAQIAAGAGGAVAKPRRRTSSGAGRRNRRGAGRAAPGDPGCSSRPMSRWPARNCHSRAGDGRVPRAAPGPRASGRGWTAWPAWLIQQLHRQAPQLRLAGGRQALLSRHWAMTLMARRSRTSATR